jgi:hypothetical protein
MLNKLLNRKVVSQQELDIAYRDHWNTPLGKKVLDDLNKRFNPENITTDNPHSTAIRARGVEIMNYINRRIKDGMDGRSV